MRRGDEYATEVIQDTGSIPTTFTSALEEDIQRSVETRIARNVERARMLAQARLEKHPMHLPNLGYVDRDAILHHLLLTVREKLKRYSKFFEINDMCYIKEVMDQGLNAKVKAMCESGLFDVEQLKDLGNDPRTLKNSDPVSGVYLHILWLKTQPGRFWLYVGQASNLKARVKDHHSHRRQTRRFSLHYHVWNSSEDIASQFVTLYTSHARLESSSPNKQFFLNLAEMWMACVFQTLSRPYLRSYLPKRTRVRWGGYHLNVALPLWKSLGDCLDEEEDQFPAEYKNGRWRRSVYKFPLFI